MKYLNQILAFILISSSPLALLGQKKFAQIENLIPTPNEYRNAAGAPGHSYYQQQADYKMLLTLEDDTQILRGTETITYTNNSPDALEYLWLQLDQNLFAKTSDTKLISVERMEDFRSLEQIERKLFDYDGGFKIEEVKATNGEDLCYAINKTMLRIDLKQPLKTNGSISFSIKWWYNINDRMAVGGRSGYEYFEDEDNYIYTIAQFFPRMCVYDDVSGWQNKQFLGRGEFTLPFGNYDVSLTVPGDHIVSATGILQNESTVLSDTQRKRLQKARKADAPVFIVNQEEAEQTEKNKS